MGDGENPHRKREADGLLAGLEAGIIAALVLLGWLALASAWYRRSIWTAANIMATTFYGDAALGRDFTSRTVAGIALRPARPRRVPQRHAAENETERRVWRQPARMDSHPHYRIGCQHLVEARSEENTSELQS